MKTDRIAAVILMFFGSLVFLYAKDWQLEAGFYPRTIALLITALSLLLFIRPQNTQKRTFADMWREARANWQMIVIVVLTFALASSIEILGFFVALPVYIVLVMLVLGVRKLKSIVIPAVLTTAIIYIIFVLMLQIRIPVAFFIS